MRQLKPEEIPSALRINRSSVWKREEERESGEQQKKTQLAEMEPGLSLCGFQMELGCLFVSTVAIANDPTTRTHTLAHTLE